MIVTAWSNGRHTYGIKIRMSDRQQFFSRRWKTVTLAFEASIFEHRVTIRRPTFWEPRYGLIASVEIGLWLEEQGLIPWPSGQPPRLLLTPEPQRRFLLSRLYPHQMKQGVPLSGKGFS